MIGVGIVSFNRPYYLRRLLKTLVAQTDQRAAYLLFQDGAVNAFSGRRRSRDKNIEECVKYFENAKLPNKQLHVRKHNVGISRNIKDALDFMSENYDQLMLIEDDVLLSPHWIRLSHLLFKEMEQRPHIASFSPGFRRYVPKAEIFDNLDYLQETTQHLWCECFTADTWRRLVPHMEPYYALVNQGDYILRADPPIRELHKSRGVEQKATSQDAARVAAIELEGLKRAQCTVNRGFSIGRMGIHFDNERYTQHKLGEQIPYVFDEDADRTSFEWLV